MLYVQSEAMAPLVRAFDGGASDTVAAPGLNVPAGVGHFRVLEIVQASGGACVAALPQLLERALVKRVVAVNTGSAEKYLPALHYFLS